MRPWETIFKKRFDQTGWELPAEDWDRLQARYAALRKRRVLRNWALGVIPVAVAAGLALLFVLKKPDADEIPPVSRDASQLAQATAAETGVAEAENLPEVPVSQSDSQLPATPVKTPTPARFVPTEAAVSEDEAAHTDERERVPAEPASKELQSVPSVPEVRQQLLPKQQWEEAVPSLVRTKRKTSLSTNGTLAQLKGSTGQAGRHVYTDAASRLGTVGDGSEIASRSQLQKIAAFTQASDLKIGEIHHRPLELGLTAGIPLTPRWTLVSGIEYARYPSSFSYSVSGMKNQDAHYLGIPLRMDYYLVNRDRLHLYLGAGGLVDRGILARLDGERIPADGFGFSLLAAGGIQWDINRFLGLYLEPRYSLFLSDTDGRLVTFRTESPARFSLAAGLRVNL